VLPPFKSGCGFSDAGKAIEVIYPLPNAKIYVPLEINGERGKTIFTAAHRRASAKIFWSLDDAFITTTQNFHQVALNPSVGKHVITLVDESGVSVSREFEIVEKEK
jgi:penicillin-binding protein 1C